jgi:hypothetical protein
VRGFPAADKCLDLSKGVPISGEFWDDVVSVLPAKKLVEQIPFGFHRGNFGAETFHRSHSSR